MHIASIAIIGSVLLGVSPAVADAVVLYPLTADVPEADIIGSFLEGQDLSHVDALVVDMNRDERGEIIARLKDQCADEAGKQCRTVIFRHGVSGWSQVFDAYVSQLELGEVGIGAMRSLYDGSRKWEWNGSSFDMKVGSLGVEIEFSLAPADYVDPLLEQFGAGARQLFDQNDAVAVMVAPVNLTGPAGVSHFVTRLEGPGVCGAVYGCPWRVLEVQDGQYVSLAEGSGQGKIVVLPVQRDGWSDIAAEMPKGGLATYAWDGSRYSISELVQGAK